MLAKKTSSYKVGIIGCGRGGSRFVDACLFMDNVELFIIGFNINNKSLKYARKNDLEFILYENLSDDFIIRMDLFIISTPITTRIQITERLNIYTGDIIFDKPFADNLSNYYRIADHLKYNNYFTFYTRDFIVYDKLNILEYNEIKIPIQEIDSDVDPVKVLIPHILNMIIKILKIGNFCVVRNYNKVYLKYKGVTFLFRFDISFGNIDGILFNDNIIPWPSYLPIYYRMLSDVLEKNEYNNISKQRQNIDKKIAEIMQYL